MARFLDRKQNIATQYQVRFSILLLIIVTVLYGSTYQQFNHFNIADPRGISDALSYIKMSHGNYDVSFYHKYRPVIPYMASLVQKVLHPLVTNEGKLDNLSFYVVNFVITTGTALLLFGVFVKLGFEWQLSILGTIFFLTSRVTVSFVGTPLVDSLYFFAIGAIVYLMLYEKVVLLACLCPLFILFKESVIPFLFLPFVLRSMRNWKMVSSVFLSFSILFVFRHIIQLENIASPSLSLFKYVQYIWFNIPLCLRWLCTLAGIHDLFNGFAFLAVFAPLGLFVNRIYCKYKIPTFLFLIIPMAFGLSLSNGNMGRLFFVAYVPIIAYSLILIEHSLGNKITVNKKK